MKPSHKTLGLLCSAILGLATACGKHPRTETPTESSLPAAVVRVVQATDQREPITEEVVGTVCAKTRATLAAKISGRIQELPVHLGQAVKKGDLVARLDAAEIKARLDQAQASLEQAERDWNRASSLFKGQAVTRSEYDRADAQHRLAKAGVEEAAAMMRYTEVLAPFDGVVSRKWADAGDLASPGKPLADIEDPTSLQLQADLPESVAGKIRLGTDLAVQLDELSSNVEGKVSEIAPTADPASRTVRIKVDLTPAPGLIPGRFARLLVPIGDSKTVRVPATALVQRGQMEIVFVVTDHQAHLHLVKSGKRDGDQVVILSGLDAGVMVAADGAGLLADGQPVEVK
jgi:RND family efflux transporter MFP subunit